jgi:hypothetical protein
MRIRSTLLALLLAMPRLASAATLTLGDSLVSRTECADRASQEVTLAWDFTGASGSTYEIAASDVSGCPDSSSSTSATTAVLVDGITASSTSGSYPGSGDAAIHLSDVLSAAGVASSACTAAADSQAYVCVRLLDASGNVTATASARLRLQVTAPPPPASVAVTPGESALHVSWSAGTATDAAPASSKTYRVLATAGGVTKQSSETSDTSIRFAGLEIGTTYDVQVVSYSEAGNASEPSELVAGTPVNVTDYWEAYKQAGGTESGGCSHGPGGVAALASVLWTAVVLRRRARRGRVSSRAGLLVWGGLLALALAQPARAQELPGGWGAEELPANRGAGELTGSWGSVELRLSGYRPRLDAEFHGSASPYANAFGDGRAYLGSVHIGKEVWRGFGILEVGAGAGFGQLHGHGLLEDGSRSADTTLLRVLPLSLTLTYRLDDVASRWGIPLVPYARVALQRYLWWVKNGAGGTSSWSGVAGSGATDGYALTAGVALPLGALDPTLSRDLHQNAGLHDVFLFADATKSVIDDFGSRTSWDLSDATQLRWSAGLLFTF